MNKSSNSRIGKLNPSNTGLLKENASTSFPTPTKRSLSVSGNIPLVENKATLGNAENQVIKTNTKIKELEALLIKQAQQKQILLEEKKKMQDEIDLMSQKEQKIAKKQNLFGLIGNSEENKQKTLKKKGHELNLFCEESLQVLEKLSKLEFEPEIDQINKCPSGIAKTAEASDLLLQLLKDSKSNKELLLLYRTLKCKYLFGKTKNSIKKNLKIKQNEQIKSMQKLIKKLANSSEHLEDYNTSLLLSSLDLNTFQDLIPSKCLGDTHVSMCDLAQYIKDKTMSTSLQIMKEKQSLELYRKIYKRQEKAEEIRKNMKNDCKAIEDALCKGLNSSESVQANEGRLLEEEIKTKRMHLEKLKGMLKFWVEEYSKLANIYDIEDNLECVEVEIEL